METSAVVESGLRFVPVTSRSSCHRAGQMLVEVIELEAIASLGQSGRDTHVTHVFGSPVIPLRRTQIEQHLSPELLAISTATAIDSGTLQVGDTRK